MFMSSSKINSKRGAETVESDWNFFIWSDVIAGSLSDSEEHFVELSSMS